MFECSEEYRRYSYKQHSGRYFHLDKWFAVAAALLCVLTMLLSACNIFPTPSQSGTSNGLPVTTPTRATSSPTPAYTPPTISLTVTDCPSLSINWDGLVGTKPGVNKVQRVACGSLEGSGSLTALVNVRYYTPDGRLDFYVYDNLYGTPTKRFSVQGLLNGDAKISPSSTVITAEASPSNTLPTLPNLFKEYQWNGTGFGQILFPGIYPDMTYYQAEQSQAMVNANLPNQGWRTSGFGILDKLTHDIFHWPQTKDQVVTYNSSESIYIVESFNLGPGGGGVVAHLFRLDNILTNIFEIKQLTPIDGSLAVSSPAAGAQLSSPAQVSASYTASSGILGRVVLYDDTYFASADSGAIHGPATSGTVSFTASVSFRLDSKGLREGVVAFYATNQNNIAYSNDVILVKVFYFA